jgi:hypothetical protein
MAGTGNRASRNVQHPFRGGASESLEVWVKHQAARPRLAVQIAAEGRLETWELHEFPESLRSKAEGRGISRPNHAASRSGSPDSSATFDVVLRPVAEMVLGVVAAQAIVNVSGCYVARGSERLQMAEDPTIRQAETAVRQGADLASSIESFHHEAICFGEAEQKPWQGRIDFAEHLLSEVPKHQFSNIAEDKENTVAASSPPAFKNSSTAKLVRNPLDLSHPVHGLELGISGNIDRKESEWRILYRTFELVVEAFTN